LIPDDFSEIYPFHTTFLVESVIETLCHIRKDKLTSRIHKHQPLQLP